jgi:hypothetical protein
MSGESANPLRSSIPAGEDGGPAIVLDFTARRYSQEAVIELLQIHANTIVVNPNEAAC